jgi:hypothetical protein
MSKLGKDKVKKLSELHYFVDRLILKMEKLDTFGSSSIRKPLPNGIVRKDAN